MDETTVKRKRVFLFFLVMAVLGGTLVIVGKPRSHVWEVGAILLLACFVPASYFFFFFAKKRARLLPLPLQFDTDEPFVPHLVVDLKLSDKQGRAGGKTKSECRRIFVIGQNGFSARFIVPAEAAGGAAAPLRVEAQFLRPEVALPQFAEGTAFSVIDGKNLVGTGEVVSVLDTPRVGLRSQ